MNTEIGEMRFDSVAALRFLPVGSRLYLVRTLAGPCTPTVRTVICVDDRDIVLRTEDGHVSYLTFVPGMQIEVTESGFLVRESLVRGDRGKVAAEYIVELQRMREAS